MRITERFSSEHDVFLSQLTVIEDLVRRGADVSSVVAAIRTLSAPLLLHADNEERVLFGELELAMGGEGGPLATLTEEHREIHGQIDRLVAGPPRWELELVLDAFLRVLRAHIDKEEGVLFPAAEQLLDGERLERLDRDIRKTPSEVTR